MDKKTKTLSMILGFIVLVAVIVLVITLGKDKDVVVERDDLYGITVPIETAIANKFLENPAFDLKCSSEEVKPSKGTISICGLKVHYSVKDPDGVTIVLDKDKRITEGTKIRYRKTVYVMDKEGIFQKK